MCTSVSHKLLFLSVWTLCPLFLVAYQAPEHKEDIFATTACPAFLVFQSVAYMADMTIELPCRCKPEEALSVVWYYQKYMGSGDVRVLTDFGGTALVDSTKVGRNLELQSRFSIRLFSLIIYRAQKSDSGHYICGTVGREFFYGYDVDMQVVRQVSFLTEPRAREAESKRNGPGAFTSYWPWSLCDRCDVQGEQVRGGLCYITSEHLHPRYRREKSNVTSCGSAALPRSFEMNEGAELVVRKCHVSCSPKSKTKPKQKALLEFLGYGDPTSPKIPIHFHDQPLGSNLVLSCPGAQPQHAVGWDRGSVPMYRFQYMSGADQSPRVFIDAGHQLHFRPVLSEDRGTYYCWLQGRKAAEIRLGAHAQPRRRRHYLDPDAIYAINVILAYLYCFTAAFIITQCLRVLWTVFALTL